PERFRSCSSRAASSICALGITRLQSLARVRGDTPRLMRIRLAGGFVLTVAVTLLLANIGPLVSNQHAALKGRPMDAPPRTIDQDFHQARGTRWALAYY